MGWLSENYETFSYMGRIIIQGFYLDRFFQIVSGWFIASAVLSVE